ncbi:zona occludens toxin-like protein, partial [Pseudoalteromonas sp. S4492]
YFTSNESAVESVEETSQVDVVNNQKDTSSNTNNAAIQVLDGEPVSVGLPYGATDIFVTGIQEVKRPERTHREYIFEFITERYGTFSINSYE